MAWVGLLPVRGRRRAACRPGLRAGLLLCLLLALPAAPAWAQDLLLPVAPAEAARAAAEPRLGATRSRLVRLNLDLLERQMLPRGRDHSPQRVTEALRRPGRVTLGLFPGLTVELRRESVEAAVDGGYVWSGRLLGEARGFALLVFGNDMLTGRIERNGRSFLIEPLSGGLHRVSEVDPAAFPPDDPPGGAFEVPSQGRAGPQGDSRAATSRIDVLIGYTQAAQRASANINNEMNLAIAMANRTFANSRVNIRFRLVGTMLVPGYNERGKGLEVVLRDMTSGRQRGPVSLRQRRDALRADLVAVLTQTANQSYCGIAWLPQSPGPFTSHLGYSVTWRLCIANHTFTHEVGHNMGLNHDRFVTAAAPNSQYNFGYVNLNARIRDVMAYNNACAVRGFNCTRVQYFSTPRVKAGGKKIGIAAGRPGAADGARRLNETRRAIAAYR